MSADNKPQDSKSDETPSKPDDKSSTDTAIPVSRDQWTQKGGQARQDSEYSGDDATGAWMKNQDQDGPYHAIAEVDGKKTEEQSADADAAASGHVTPSVATQGSAKPKTDS